MKQTFFKKEDVRQAKGFTLVEILIYLFLLIVLLVVIIGFIVSLTKTYQVVQATKNKENSAILSLERFTRDIRGALSVDTVRSTLDSNPGILVLNSLNDAGVAQTTKYIVENGILNVYENNVYVGPLTVPGVTISNLIYRLSTSTNSQSVKIEITLQAKTTNGTSTDNFYTTVELRGSL